MFFYLYKILMALILPPNIFLLVYIVGMILLYRRRRNRKLVLKIWIINTLIFYMFLIRPTKDFFVWTIEHKLKPIQIEELEDVEGIVVLGSGVLDKVDGSLGLKGQPSQEAFMRLGEGIRLYNKKRETGDRVKIFLAGGKVYNRDRSESEVYRDYILGMGIPLEDIVIDDSSKSTYENAKNIKLKLEEENVGKIALVTSTLHMPRSANTFEKFGIDYVKAPCNYSNSRDKYKIRDFLPNYENGKEINRVLWEYVGSVYYKLKSY